MDLPIPLRETPLMGLFGKKKITAPSASRSKPASKPKPRPDEKVDTFITGQVPPPATGEPFSIALQSGKEIALGVSVYSDDLATMKELIGKPQDDKEVTKTVKVWISRDLTSAYPDAVRVETKSGRHVGWISKNQAYFACELINQIGEAAAESRPQYAGGAPRCQVSMRIEEASWDYDDYVDDDTGEAVGWVADIGRPEIRIGSPVNIADPT
jgi:hypothetical protein